MMLHSPNLISHAVRNNRAKNTIQFQQKDHSPLIHEQVRFSLPLEVFFHLRFYIYMLGRTVTSLLWGIIIADRYGRKHIIIIGIIIVVIFNTLLALAEVFGWMLSQDFFWVL